MNQHLSNIEKAIINVIEVNSKILELNIYNKIMRDFIYGVNQKKIMYIMLENF